MFAFRPRLLLAALACAGLLTACGSSGASHTPHCKGATMTMANGQVMCDSAMHTTSAGASKKSGETQVQVSTSIPEVNGVRPLPMRVLATKYWQGMAVKAEAMTPIRFLVFNGTKERMLYPPKHASFHLMVVLDDRLTNQPIPYSTVWATITSSSGKVVYDNRQWPMISAFMGPHYGNDVALPRPGTYKLTVLISPPVAARRMEYKNVWLHQHRLVEHFKWNGTKVTSSSASQSSSSSSSMDMSGGSMTMTNSAVKTVNGQKAVPTKTVATSYWQGMKIQTSVGKASKLAVFDGSKETMKTVPGGSAANLVVALSDRHTSEPVPYATVRAVIRNSHGKVVYRGTQLPTISAFGGPSYSNNVTLAGAGRYSLTLTVSPPVCARHLEYQHVWLHDHTVVQHFTWNGQD